MIHEHFRENARYVVTCDGSDGGCEGGDRYHKTRASAEMDAELHGCQTEIEAIDDA